MIGRSLRAIAVALLALLLLAAGGLAAFAYLPALDDQRRALATRLLEWLVERPVSIAGPVSLRPGRLTEVTLADVRIGDAGPEAWRGTFDLDQLRLSFSTVPALLGDLAVEELAGRGLRVDLDGQSDAGGPFRLGSFVRPIARYLALPASERLSLEDVRISRRAGPDGWSSDVVLSHATAVTPASGERTVVLAGSVNDRPFDLKASFEPPAANGDGRHERRFALEASLPGIEERIEGALDVAGETLAADVTLTVASIGDLLETLRLQRQLEGRGLVRLDVAGPVDALAAETARLEVVLATGETVTLDGRIADLSRLAGVQLAVRADLRDQNGAGMRPVETFDVEVTGLEGRLSGSLAALSVTDLSVQTSIASADLADIGPIGIERVTRDEAGLLGFRGLTIKSGDPAAPSLDLRGAVEDVLGAAGIALQGRFDLDVMALALGRPAPPALGRLAGTLALDDSDGPLRLQALDAALAAGGPLALTLTLPTGAATTSLELAIDIADVDALATALDKAPIGGGSAAFAGSLRVVDEARFIGRGHVGSSSLWLDLRQGVAAGRIVIDGTVRSPRLLLADLPRIAGLAGLWGKEEEEEEEADGTAEAAGGGIGLDATLDTEAEIVDAAGVGQGAFNARLTVRDKRVVLDPLRLDYLGGTATATLSMALDQDPPSARLDADLNALNTGALLTELGIQPLLAGQLDATLALIARGSDEAAIRRSLDGEVELAMGEGRIGSRLIDLTAQNFVSWLFSAGSDTRLVCAAARLRVTKGVANIEGLMLRTENVQLIGGGSVNLGRETLDIAFDPRPTRGGILQTATPFRVHGPLAAPEVELGSAGGLAGRAVVETVTLPFNILGSLFGGNRQASGDCTLEE
jgi:hypothetical protein